MTKDQLETFFSRIDKLTKNRMSLFGKMNAHQAICHCTDQFRMAFGEKKAEEYGNVDSNKLIALARAGKTVPTPKGFDQVKGEGTKPVDFEKDKKLLKKYIIKFSKLPTNYKFSEHPFLGNISRKRWEELVNYHLNHHLNQFGV